MNRSDLINVVSERASLDPEVVTHILDEIVDVIVGTVDRKEQVVIRGFGKFVPRVHPARRRHNPATGFDIDIPTTVSVVFNPAKGLKVYLSRRDRPAAGPGQLEPATYKPLRG